MVRNTAIRETDLLHALEDQLRTILPRGWTLTAACENVLLAGCEADLLLDVRGPDGSLVRVVVEAKYRLDAQGVPAALRHLDRCQGVVAGAGQATTARLVAAPYLSPRTRDLLAQAGAGWFDATGNLRLELTNPALFVDRVGASRTPHGTAPDRRLRSLKGHAAARVVRTLLDEPGPHRVRALAARAGVSVATSARVLDLLVREALVDRDGTGTVTAVRKRSLMYRWIQDYRLTTTNDTRPVLAPRGLDHLMRQLPSFGSRYAVSGSAAVRAHLPAGHTAVTPFSLLMLFVDDGVVAQDALNLKPVERGANVLLMEPFDPVVYGNPAVVDEITFVSPAQAVADLMTGPGRSSEEAAQLLAVLAADDPEWAR